MVRSLYITRTSTACTACSHIDIKCCALKDTGFDTQAFANFNEGIESGRVHYVQ